MAILRFSLVETSALIAHAFAASEHRSVYGGKPERGLLFVKDQGIYLMSTGLPGLMIDDEKAQVVYAKGYSPQDEGWYEAARAAVGGDDFAVVLPLSRNIVLEAYAKLAKSFCVKVTSTQLEYYMK